MRGRFRRCQLLLAWAAGLAACWSGCAKVAAPSGGPEDRTLPRVAAMAPDSGSVAAHPDTISILFSKKMDRGSVRDWLFITPPLPVSDRIWKGNRYDLVLRQRPDSGTTYVLLLGSEVIDRRRNPLGPWAAAFSTGRSMDDGRIEGAVRTTRLKSAGVYVYAWPWADSLPAAGGEIPVPLRMGQCGKDGKFRLDFVPRGVALRICALYDSGSDRSYEPEDDLWGCLAEAVTLGDTTAARTGLEIYLVFPDEPGTLKGVAADSSCLGRGAAGLRVLIREADSLAVALGVGVPGDSLAADSLIGFGGKPRAAADTTAIRLRLAEIDSLLPAARADSARCAVPIIVRLFDGDSSLVAEEQGEGGFEFRDVAPGIYRIRAFRDVDANGEPGDAEAAGEYPFPIELAPGRSVTDLKVPLRPAR
jgi:hypothetical protein